MSTEHLDVVVVGAGLSGVGTACHLEREHPQRSYAILEAREDLGGTWSLFTYPGIRSDSDMASFALPYKPWPHKGTLGDGAHIKEYLREAARDDGILQRGRGQARQAARDIGVRRGGLSILVHAIPLARPHLLPSIAIHHRRGRVKAGALTPRRERRCAGTV